MEYKVQYCQLMAFVNNKQVLHEQLLNIKNFTILG